MKIIINDCYGGFGISEKAARRYCELKGVDYKNRWYTYSSADDINEVDEVIRTDPLLIQIVEELGEEASACGARLKIEEIPNGSYYRISEYDGWEEIILKEAEQYKWHLAKENE